MQNQSCSASHCMLAEILTGLVTGAAAIAFYLVFPSQTASSAACPLFWLSAVGLVLYLIALANAVQTNRHKLICSCSIHLFHAILGTLLMSLLALAAPTDISWLKIVLAGLLFAFAGAFLAGLCHTVHCTIKALCLQNPCPPNNCNLGSCNMNSHMSGQYR